MERMPTARERLDNFEANKNKQPQEKFEEAIYGKTAGVTDFSDEARQRLEEGMAYEEHLRKMMEEPSMSSTDKIVNQVQQAEEAYKAQEQLTDAEREQKHLERRADDRVVHLMNYAKQIGKLRASQEQYVNGLHAKYQEAVKHGLTASLDDFINDNTQYRAINNDLRKKEDYLNNQLFDMSQKDSQVFTDRIINEIIDATDMSETATTPNGASETTPQAEAQPEVQEEVLDADIDAEQVEDEELIADADADADYEAQKEAATRQLEESMNRMENPNNLSEDELDDNLNRINNPNTSSAERASLLEYIRKSKFMKVIVGLVTTALLTSGIGSFVKANKQTENVPLNNQTKIENQVEAAEKTETESTVEKAEKINTYEQFLESSEYRNHKPGDSIEFSAELEKQINERRTGNYGIFAPIQGETLDQKAEFVKKAGYYSPELIASFEKGDLPNFKLQYIDMNGNMVDAVSNDEINQAVEQMKSNPQLMGANYDRFIAALEDTSLETMHVEAGQMNVYKYMNRDNMRYEMGMGQTSSEGDAVVFKMSSGVRLAIMEHCANVLIYKIDIDTTLIPIPDDDEPEGSSISRDPKPEKKTEDTPDPTPKNGDTPDPTPGKPTPPGTPNRPPQTPPNTPNKPPQNPPELEAKDFDKLPDANDAVNSDGKASGKNLQGAGELKDEVRSTKETVDEQITEQRAGQKAVDQATEAQAKQNLQNEQAQINKTNEQLNKESDNIITSENSSANTAVNQNYEDVQKQAGEAQEGVNRTIELVKPEDKVTDKTIFNKMDELRDQGFSEDDMKISKDADGNYKVEVDANQGKVEMP